MKRSAFLHRFSAIVIAGLGLAVTTGAHATVLETFDNYTASSGNYNSNGGAYPTGGYNNGLVGTNGWSNSSSNSNGYIHLTTTSGLYTGGQALAGVNSNDAVNNPNTYIGGKSGSLLANNAFTFDLQWNFTNGTVGVGEAGVGGWTDTSPTGTYANSEAGFVVGVQNQDATHQYFGLRLAGFKSTASASDTIAAGSGPGTINTSNGKVYATGYTPTNGDWYRLQVVITGAGTLASGGTVTLSVRDLTTGTFIDFDPNATGLQNFGVNLVGADFGANISGYTGYVVRATGLTNIDNIQSGAQLPEPTFFGSLSFSGVIMLVRRRAKKNLA